MPAETSVKQSVKKITSKNYFLSIEKIPSESPTFPAYFVGSTAPNNVEDSGIGEIEDPQRAINEIAEFLSEKDYPEILIVVHGYNTALGSFGDKGALGEGTKGWYQNIRDHIEKNCDRRADGFTFIGYRWPSERINGGGSDSITNKIRYAFHSLSAFLKVIVGLSLSLLLIAGIWVLSKTLSPFGEADAISLFIFAVSSIIASLVLTLFLLRIVGYFRDAYRARNFGVPDLVELIRQIDKAVAANPNWPQGRRIKLSFIGHSMGAFVVSNTIRILSDVFDTGAIGNLAATSQAKFPSANIGHVFSLGRLVLVSPDIPAEAIISSRANFLSSALRRFEETYLFSNEGDMALKLASTAANYASFPARTLEGGYRLGNVVVRSPSTSDRQHPPGQNKPQYGILNFDATQAEGKQMIDMEERAGGQGGVQPTTTDYSTKTGEVIQVSSFLEYLHMLEDKPLSYRQRDILEFGQKPIAELFTVFDCTDYAESWRAKKKEKIQKVSLLSNGLGKRSLSFLDYVQLVFSMISGAIDNHGGYFYSGEPGEKTPAKKPEAYVTKQLIYGLACLGFRPFLSSLSEKSREDVQPLAVTQQELQALSELCESRNIQVLLAAERYNRDVLGIWDECDRAGY